MFPEFVLMFAVSASIADMANPTVLHQPKAEVVCEAMVDIIRTEHPTFIAWCEPIK